MIVGIDPGTTVGWAVLGLDGSLVEVNSKRGAGVDEVIARLVKQGRVFVVGADKAKVPSTVQDVSTKLGARLVVPAQDLLVAEKRELTQGYSFDNAHEMDALASAMVAFRKFQPLLLKIQAVLGREGKQRLFESVAELVIREEVSIHAALAILTEEEQVEAPVVEEESRDADVVRLYRALRTARKDVQELLKRNEQVMQRAKRAEARLATVEKRAESLVKPKSAGEVAELKEKQVVTLSKKVKKLAKERRKLKNKVRRLESALVDDAVVALPRLSHLGWVEVQRTKLSTVVFVDDPNKMSKRAVSFARECGVEVVVTPKLPGARVQSVLPFAFVRAGEVQKLPGAVLVRGDWLKEARAGREVLSRMVKAYKEERAMTRDV